MTRKIAAALINAIEQLFVIGISLDYRSHSIWAPSGTLRVPQTRPSTSLEALYILYLRQGHFSSGLQPLSTFIQFRVWIKEGS
jgi:hypothetical protein